MNPKDMLIAELKQRVAELKAENLKLTLDKPVYSRRQLVSRLKHAEAELATMKAMLRMAWNHPEWSDHWYEIWCAELRYRVESGRWTK